MLVFKVPSKRGYERLKRRAFRLSLRLGKIHDAMNDRVGFTVEFDRYELPTKNYLILYFEANKKRYSVFVKGSFMKHFMAQNSDLDTKIKLSDDEIERLIKKNQESWDED
jgi:hypothetical protein